MINDPDYARVFTKARCIAWAEGYALLVHGTCTRDLDLLAVPWTDAACHKEHLIARVVYICNLRIVSAASAKPHGRSCWTLCFKDFGDPRFIDFSVMPRAALTGGNDD